MYNKAFYLEGNRGNNAFAWEQRDEPRRLYVPSVIDGSLSDVELGDEVVFEDVDEHGVLQSCKGLRNFIKCELRGVPCVVVDNHNHALYFWAEALEQGLIERGAKLLHVDQHKDMREAPEKLDLEDVFRFTNEVCNVGNYIRPAIDEGLIGEVQMVTGEADLVSEVSCDILNLDLDFFAPEMSYIDFDRVCDFLHEALKSAKFVTIATSPFFIDQELAISKARLL
ncbi:hypothetical protein HOD30_02250 [Candidatus Peregrinibacteria bacterium]|jgi:hypothetical protein|nr:hypothetical protein [Candidatus Peregrinibacteria bacterium]MBT4631758.1 hypothetical protein [Candidatus Peregrinibacteria bacterium]MBT5517269.1 hypothetical protein [Candidatus Peregrinibacteria bacterium]MBT5824517.1 hypothetical protein [Candidatus Peregrinibacteria bacterium]